jgi:beta-lactamase regulating signal transducer with metallopeptidase domain
MNLETIAGISVERMLNWVVVGVTIALFAELLLRVMRRPNSGTRFAVWFSALLGVVAIPLADYFLPQSVLSYGAVRSGVILPSSWALDIVMIWAALALVALLRVALGLAQIRRLRRASTKIPFAALDPLLRRRLRERRGFRGVTLYENEWLRTPTAIGFLSPSIILPSWTLKELSVAELDAVLLHELAHIDRWDDWTNLAQKIIGAIFFFHPAVWWIERRLALEREMACDDVVLGATSNPREYARCLVSLAEKSLLRRGLVLAQAAVTRMRQTARRVSQILDAKRAGATAVRKPALALVAAFSLVSTFALSRAPQLVAFEPSGTPSTGRRAAAPESLSALRDLQGVIASSTSAGSVVTPKAVSGKATLSGTVGAAAKAVAQNARLQKSPPRSPVQMARLRQNPSQRMAQRSNAYVVVVETGYAASGEVFWTIGVVQLTTFHPHSARTQPDTPPKSI